MREQIKKKKLNCLLLTAHGNTTRASQFPWGSPMPNAVLLGPTGEQTGSETGSSMAAARDPK